jgi:hypothetical protein
MTNHSLLIDPQEVIGRQWSDDPSPERRRILGLARDALLFPLVTGRQSRFERFRASPRAEDASRSEDSGDLQERLNEAVEFFKRLLDESGAAEERERIQVILDILRFVSSSGQSRAFGEYLEHLEANGPPYVMGAFETKEEAEAWFKQQPEPPEPALILIANTYYEAIYDLRVNKLRLPRVRSIEYYLAELKREHPPHAVVSFGSLAEAESWLQAQPNPARWAWVSIAGEFYLAAYYANINHRAFFPLSMADGYEVEPSE